MTRPGLPLPDRLWPKVDVRGPDECWIWTGCRVRDGYGSLKIEKRGVAAHRLSYQLANGPIPDGLLVLHTCDNPPCCNPAHLFLGTHRDNARDMLAKGRWASGARPAGAMVTQAEKIDIQELRASGWKLQDIATRFGISKSYASAICLGRAGLPPHHQRLINILTDDPEEEEPTL